MSKCCVHRGVFAEFVGICEQAIHFWAWPASWNVWFNIAAWKHQFHYSQPLHIPLRLPLSQQSLFMQHVFPLESLLSKHSFQKHSKSSFACFGLFGHSPGAESGHMPSICRQEETHWASSDPLEARGDDSAGVLSEEMGRHGKNFGIFNRKVSRKSVENMGNIGEHFESTLISGFST